MTFGIDLGTTNSLIGAGDELFTGLVSSNVNIEAQSQSPRDYISEDVVSSYKTSMSMGSDGELSIVCSAIILKDLARKAAEKTGEECTDVVISVPAYFSTSQREAVHSAAKKAGLTVRSLINEPTAAALYTCRTVKDLVVVYDLGGGTFDITIVDARAGSYAVVATDGEVLGGDDFDEALAQEIISTCKIPIRYRNALNMRKLKSMVRLAKEQIQMNGLDVCVSLTRIGMNGEYTLTLDTYKKIMKEVFQETVVRAYYIINKNIPISEKPKLVFVGGSTACPYLREMVADALNLTVIESDVCPDLVVAKGAAMYARMVDEGTAFDMVEDVTKRLCIAEKYNGTMTVIEANSLVPAVGSVIVSNSERDTRLKLRLYQGDQVMPEKNEYIGTLLYDYKTEMEAGEGLVKVTVKVDRDGIVRLSAQQILLGDASKQEIELSWR